MNPMNVLLLLAFQAGSARSSPLVSLVPMIVLFAIFYLVVMAPMRKRQKALQQKIEALKKGDRVVTTGGIYGEIAGIEDPILLLKIADNVRIRIAKSAIAGLEGEEAEQGGKKP